MFCFVFSIKMFGFFFMKNCNIFLIFAQNMDLGYTLESPQTEAVLTSTHDLCFELN